MSLFAPVLCVARVLHRIAAALPLAAMAWAYAFASLQGLEMHAFGPLLFLGMALWLGMLLSRCIRAMLDHAIGSKELARIALFALPLLASLLYLISRDVPLTFLRDLKYPLILSLAAGFCSLLHQSSLSALLQAMSFGIACCLPTFAFTLHLSLLSVLFHPGTWYLVILFFLFFIDIRHEQDRIDSVRLGDSLLVPMGQLLLLIFSLSSAYSAVPSERGLLYTIVLGNASLALMMRMRRHWDVETTDSLRWLIFAAVPLMGLALFN